MRRAKRSKKVKKAIIIIILAAIIIAGIVVLIINANKNKENVTEENNTVEEQSVYKIPNTEYEGMEVTHNQVEYLKYNNQTVVTIRIKNTSGRATESQIVHVIFYDKDGNELTNSMTPIKELEIDEELENSMILSGDFSAIAEIKIEK